MYKILVFIIALFIVTTSCAVFANEERPSSFFIKITPSIVAPVGENTDYYNLGYGIGLSGDYNLRDRPFFLSGNVDYMRSPIEVENLLSLISFGAGGGVRFGLSPKLKLVLFTNGGGYYGYLSQESDLGKTHAFNPYITAGTGLYYLIRPRFNLGIESSYKHYFGLYSGIALSLGTSFQIGGVTSDQGEKQEKKPIEKLKPLNLSHVEFDDILPVFYKYYDEHPIGTATLWNSESDVATDINVDLFVKQYMDIPKQCLVHDALNPDEQIQVNLSALFTDTILEITESTKVGVEIKIQYIINGVQYESDYRETIRIFDRNAIVWDDDRRAAVFVTAKDPLVLQFSKNTMGYIKSEGNQSVNKSLTQAIALFEALSLYGVSYVVDPRTPYEELSKDKQAIDYLQFPRQTFEYKAGDCDDLSVLYNALLESIGIETAFITIPGHIFIAFSADMSPDEARKEFTRSDEFIFKEGKAWIPVEVTELGKGFLEAWETGARNWRQSQMSGNALFYPVYESWKVYEPVALPGETISLTLPSAVEVVTAFNEEVMEFVNRELDPQVSKLRVEIRKSGETSQLMNKLGILYARYSLFESAKLEFGKAISKDEKYVPALLNMGNVSYVQNDVESALSYYDRASKIDPNNPSVLLCVARAHHKLENYGIAKKAYKKLKSVAPDLAQQYSYLDLRGEESLRAARISGVEGAVIWAE